MYDELDHPEQLLMSLVKKKGHLQIRASRPPIEVLLGEIYPAPAYFQTSLPHLRRKIIKKTQTSHPFSNHVTNTLVASKTMRQKKR